MIGKNLIAAAGNGISTVAVAEAIDFDGTNDYLRRTSDLTGNTTSKTFTFSAWIWQGDTATSYFYVVSNGTNQRFVVRVVSGTLSVEGTNTSNAVILQVTCDLAAVSRTATFYHVLISMDMANAANRSIYINDIAQSLTVTTYTNAAIPFNQVDHVVAGTEGGGARDKGRLSNVFLDYTYRDLSVTANRRLFVTADLKPAAGQASLNPILYLPMDDPTAPGANAGTGGNFTLTGTVARSGRGPNQYNAPYSDLDGTADYLSRTTAPTGIADSKTFTAHFVLNADTTSTKYVLLFSTGGTTRFLVSPFSGGTTMLKIQAFNASGTQLLDISVAGTPVINRNYVYDISIDLSDTNKRFVYINGVLQAPTYSFYVDDNIDFNISTTPKYHIGATSIPGGFFDGRLGALWFNTSYIDLSVAANLAKFVTGTGIDAKPVDLGASGELPTGTSPLIYLPMYGNNAGKNYGTGGDFTVNSGPYTGARGPNEFWGNLADFNGTTGYLARTSALSGVSDGKTFSCSFWINYDTNNRWIFDLSQTSGIILRAYVTASNTLDVDAQNSAGTTILNTVTTTTISGNTFVQICCDMTDSSKFKIYLNGVLATTTLTTYTNDTIPFSIADKVYIGCRSNLSSFWDGRISEFYLTTSYIDFTQEANRLKFRDAFGNPVDLTQQIEDAAIPNPAIYMRFPPTAFGTNSGTGGNFTVNGTITDGGQL